MNAPQNEDVSRNPTVHARLEQAVKLLLEQHGYRVDCGTVGGGNNFQNSQEIFQKRYRVDRGTVGGGEVGRVIQPERGRK
jgi:tartrate dehydratase beta subunit/fumarate hydratase class I family protein